MCVCVCLLFECVCLSLLFECVCVCVCVCANPLALLTEQKTLRRETGGIHGSGGSGRFRYRRSIGVFMCVFTPAREIRYLKPAEQKPARAAATE